MAARGYLGSGDLYLARFVGGVAGDILGPYECSKFEIKPNSEVKELVSKGRNSYGQVVETATIPQPADLTIDLPEVNKESLAIALFGTTAVLTQTAGTWSTAIDLPTKHNVWTPLPKAAILTLVAQDPTATDTYVLGEDYLLNAEMGWIKTLSTGDIGATETLKITGTFDDQAGTEIKGITSSDVRVKAILHAKNFAEADAHSVVTVYEAVIAADSAFDWLADDFNTISLPGRMKTPAGLDAPFTVRLIDASA
jgi:hypothetical protein